MSATGSEQCNELLIVFATGSEQSYELPIVFVTGSEQCNELPSVFATGSEQSEMGKITLKCNQLPITLHVKKM